MVPRLIGPNITIAPGTTIIGVTAGIPIIGVTASIIGVRSAVSNEIASEGVGEFAALFGLNQTEKAPPAALAGPSL